MKNYLAMGRTAVLLCIVGLAGIFLIEGCKKSTDGGTTQDYSPLTTGSTWTYSGTGGTSYVLTVTDKDTVANQHTYKVLTSTAGANYYLGKSGNDYYRFGALSAIGINGVEELYLKDNLAVDVPWTSAQSFNYPGIPIPIVADLTYAIKSKGGSRTVSGKVFNNVVQVHLDIAITGLGSVGGGDFYYALGVGMIENNISVTVPGQTPIVQAQLLTSYQIK